MTKPVLLPAGRELASWLFRGGRPDRASRFIQWLYCWRAFWLEFSYSKLRGKGPTTAVFPYQEGEGLVFIQGFWRAGTTLLHELLAEIPRCAAPRTWQCMDPSAMLAPFIRHREDQAMQRPMDQVMISAFSPQEDEFALMAMGIPSVYRGFLDPRRLPELVCLTEPEYWLDATSQWWKTLEAFLVWCQEPGRDRIIVKNPCHLFRAYGLAAHFPKARSVWILRDPADLWRSNLKMWRAMIERYSLWIVQNRELEYFLEAALKGYAKLLEDLHCKGCFRHQPVCSYDALTNDPAAILPALVDRLGLGQWSDLDVSMQARLLSRPKSTSAQREIPADAPESLLLRIREIHETILSAF